MRLFKFIQIILIGSTICCTDEILGNGELVEPVRYSFEFDGTEREYFVWLPNNFDSTKIYWTLVIAHGGGEVNNGSRFWMTRPIWEYAGKRGLDAIIVTPTFHKPDPIPERLPIEEGQFLVQVIDRVQDKYNTFPKIVLTGYSRGGQFSHRFALWYPDRVKACAPFAAGSWTTPDGRLLDPVLGEIKEPKKYLSSVQDKQELPEKMRDPRVAEFGGNPALPQSKKIPFLVMCGSLDERFEIAKMFAQSLREHGYSVETQWPRTPHGGRTSDEFRQEFNKYTEGAVEFFLRSTGEK